MNSYTCTCDDGYTGTNCETGMSHKDSLCIQINDGTADLEIKT